MRKYSNELLLILILTLLCSYEAAALSFSGKVVNAQTKKGQPDLEIRAAESNNVSTELKVVTDETGSFLFNGLKKDTVYQIKTNSGLKSFVVPKSMQIKTDKSDINGQKFTYYPQYSIYGTVKSDTANVKGINITFRPANPGYSYVSAKTDENGKYSADGLLYAHKYYVSASSNFTSYGIIGSSTVQISDKNVSDFEIVPVFYATGKVFDSASGIGIGNVALKAVNADDSQEFSAVTSQDGSFVITGLYYGEKYKITVAVPSGYNLSSGIDTGAVNSSIIGLNFPLSLK